MRSIRFNHLRSLPRLLTVRRAQLQIGPAAVRLLTRLSPKITSETNFFCEQLTAMRFRLLLRPVLVAMAHLYSFVRAYRTLHT